MKSKPLVQVAPSAPSRHLGGTFIGLNAIYARLLTSGLNSLLINISTHQHINSSTHQPINISTHQHINSSTYQLINSSTPNVLSCINRSLKHHPLLRRILNCIAHIQFFVRGRIDTEIPLDDPDRNRKLPRQTIAFVAGV